MEDHRGKDVALHERVLNESKTDKTYRLYDIVPRASVSFGHMVGDFKPKDEGLWGRECWISRKLGQNGSRA